MESVATQKPTRGIAHRLIVLIVLFSATIPLLISLAELRFNLRIF